MVTLVGDRPEQEIQSNCFEEERDVVCTCIKPPPAALAAATQSVEIVEMGEDSEEGQEVEVEGDWEEDDLFIDGMIPEKSPNTVTSKRLRWDQDKYAALLRITQACDLIITYEELTREARLDPAFRG